MKIRKILFMILLICSYILCMAVVSSFCKTEIQFLNERVSYLMKDGLRSDVQTRLDVLNRNKNNLDVKLEEIYKKEIKEKFIIFMDIYIHDDTNKIYRLINLFLDAYDYQEAFCDISCLGIEKNDVLVLTKKLNSESN